MPAAKTNTEKEALVKILIHDVYGHLLQVATSESDINLHDHCDNGMIFVTNIYENGEFETHKTILK